MESLITIEDALLNLNKNFVIIYGMDHLLFYFFKGKARWFQLHAAINFLIIMMTYEDVKKSLVDPIEALQSYGDRGASYMGIALHIYHMIYFKKLKFMDYLHHIISAFLSGGLAINYYWNKTINIWIFFLCGLPGSIDYVLLSLVKHKYVKKITEKKINSYLNSYLRMPGILLAVFLNYINLIYGYDNRTDASIIKLLMVLCFWNGVYFNYEACYNYGYNAYKRHQV